MTINQKIRLKYIDAFIGAEGFFIRKYLEHAFQISAPQSWRDLHDYRAMNPNAPYSPSKGASIPNDDFEMVFFKDVKEAEHYLSIIKAVYEVAPFPQSGGAV